LSPDANSTAHWGRTRKLASAALVSWLVLTVGTQVLALPLDRIRVPLLGLPLGFVLAAHVSMLAFALLAFWFAARQARIDREHGFDAADTARS
jgi:putative solute:sodium symporter small subunit